MHICTYNGILLNYEKEGNLAIWDNVNEHRGYYAKWSKSDKSRQVLYDFPYILTLTRQNKEITK